MTSTVLVHLGTGIGNIVLATPLLVALHRLGATVDVRLSADYHETADLLRDWALVRSVLPRADVRQYAAVIPAVPPFYWPAFASIYAGRPHVVPRPPDAPFYRDGQEYYISLRSITADTVAREVDTLLHARRDRSA